MLETVTSTAYCPDWYPLFVAARYLRVPPWELAQQSIWWERKALIAQAAEAYATKFRQEHPR